MSFDREAALRDTPRDRRAVSQRELGGALGPQPKSPPDGLREDGVDRARVDQEPNPNRSLATSRARDAGTDVRKPHRAAIVARRKVNLSVREFGGML